MNLVKRFGSLCALVVLFVAAAHVSNAQGIQRLISYQGLLTQPSGTPVIDGTYGIVLRLYDAPAGGNLVFEETHQSPVSKGLFNVLIGSEMSLGMVDFEQQLWLETAIVGQTPFSPRTRLAVVPYAIRAEHAVVADSISVNFDGFVRSLNSATGHLTIKGEQGVSVSRDGDTIRISASITGGDAIQEITSLDGTIRVINANGPITDIGLANQAVTEEKLADGAVTTIKITDGSVTLNKLAPGLIPTTLPPSGPAGGDLTGSYPDPLIAFNAVTSSKIRDGAVENQDLADNSVSTGKLIDGSVNTSKLALLSVTNDRLANESVSTGKLINEAVTTEKLSKTGVTPGVYGSGLTIPRITVDDRGRLVSVTQVPIPDHPFVGPAGGELTGTFPNPLIRPGVITNQKMAANAIGNLNLQDNSVTSNKIVDGTIQLIDLAPGIIPTTLPPSGPAGGVLSGTYPNPSINNAAGQQLLGAINNSATGTINDALLNTTGVIPGAYGNGADGRVPRLTVDKYGRVTAVVEQQIMRAVPTGNAGGDLQGTYPDPLINPSAGAGNRIVDALRADKLAGDADINTANNVVMLDGAGKLPAVDGSELTDLNASNITEGVLAIERGGTNSSSSLVNNRIMISSGGKIVESAPLNSKMFLIGTGSTTLPTPGTIVSGNGIEIDFVAPNFVVRNTNATVLPGLAENQTPRWDDVYKQWVPNAKFLNTTDGNFHAMGNGTIDGTLSVYNSTDIGTKDNTVNRIGPGRFSTNSIGREGATNYMYGATFINDNTNDNTSIGSLSHITNSTTINVGSQGNLQLNGIDDGVPYAFLSLNDSNNVRRALASGLALEGIVWQDGAFRLGGTTGTQNPFLQNRYINVNDHSLFFTLDNGATEFVEFDGGLHLVRVEATTNINTVSTNTTTIGNPVSLTTIGGQLDPRGDITNNAGDVVIRDQTEIIGPAFINSGTNFNTTIGQQSGTGNQSVAISVGTGANGNLHLHNIKADAAPLNMLSLDANERVRTTPFAALADEGLQYQNGAIRLGAGASMPQPLRDNAFLENRFVNLDNHSLSFTDGNAGADGANFFEIDGDNAGAPRITVRSQTDVNTGGSGNTNIGNALSTTTILGATNINSIGVFGTQIGNGDGGNGNVGIGMPAAPGYILAVNGNAQTGGNTATPNVRIDHLAGTSLTTPYPAPIGSNGFVMADINGALRKYDEATVVSGVAWMLGGNASPTPNILGTTTADAIDIQTNSVSHLVIGATGTITQGASAQQVTLTGNVDATGGLDVTGANLTVGGTNFVVNPANGNTGIGETADATFALTVNGINGTDNVRMRSLGGTVATDNYGDRANDGIVVADGTGALRKVNLPGEILFGRVAANQNGQAAAAPATLIPGLTTTVTPGVFEVEVYLQYSGTNLFDNFDVAINGTATFTTISYGVVSSGQAVSPSNVDGAGTEIVNIGTAFPPTARQTILVKGYVDVSAGGTIEVLNTDAAGIVFLQNSYIKVTRLQ